MQFRKPQRSWLVPAAAAFLLFVGNLIANLISTGMDDFVTRYRPWLWLVTVAAGVLAVGLAVRDNVSKQDPRPTSQRDQSGTQLRGAGAIGQDHSTVAGARGAAFARAVHETQLITGDNNSATYIRNLYLCAPGQAAVDEDDFNQALARYLTWVSKRYGQLSLRGIERRERQVLSLTLDDVYVSLAATVAPDRKAQQRRRNRDELAMGEGQRELIDMQQLLTLGDRLMIVGGPGSGKTTYLHLIAATLATALSTGDSTPVTEILGLADPLPLPILITLSEYNGYRRQQSGTGDPQAGTLTAFISYSLIQQEALIGLPGDFFARLLSHGRSCLLLLDGLDEVADERERWLVRRAVENVASNGGIRQLVVTCRTRTYQGETVLPEEFRVAEVQPMTPDQVTALTARWCTAAYPALDAAHETARLQAAITHLEALRSRRNEARLIETPLLVTIVAIVHYNQRRLPDERAELYEKCVDVLLAEKHHTVSESTFALADWGGSLTEKRNLLAYLAFQMMSTGEDAGRNVDEAQLTRWLRPQLVRKHGEARADGALTTFIQAMRERGSLLDERGGTYRFIHLTFQEFLCAFHLAETLREIDKIAGFLMADNRLIEPWWRETVLLTVGYLGLRSQESALALVRRLGVVEGDDETVVGAAEVAATALVELDSQDAETSALLVPRLQRLFAPAAHMNGRLRGAAGVALGRLGDPRSGVTTKNGLPDIEWVTVEPGPFLMGSDKNQDRDAREEELPQFICDLIRQPYEISRYPITVAQYHSFVDAGGYGEAAYWPEAAAQGLWREGQIRCQTWSVERREYEEEWADGPADYGARFTVDNHPQVGVSWYEALAFCRWLAVQTGTEIRLPTEAEWERAARHTDGRIYPWGNQDDVNARCNMYNTGIGSTSAVGAFPTGEATCGAADLVGNVLEWCSTQWLENYQDYAAQVDDALTGDAPRVVRGGSFGYLQGLVRCASRNGDVPDVRDDDLGFRIVRAPGL